MAGTVGDESFCTRESVSHVPFGVYGSACPTVVSAAVEKISNNYSRKIYGYEAIRSERSARDWWECGGVGEVVTVGCFYMYVEL